MSMVVFIGSSPTAFRLKRTAGRSVPASARRLRAIATWFVPVAGTGAESGWVSNTGSAIDVPADAVSARLLASSRPANFWKQM